MPCQRRRKRVHPLRGRDEVFERFCRLDVVDAERDDVDPLIDCPLHFPLDLRGLVGVFGKDQNHDPARFNRVDDRFAPVRARYDVAWRHPATNRLRFEPRYDGVRHELVLHGVAYENVMSHKLNHAQRRGGLSALKLSSRDFRFKIILGSDRSPVTRVSLSLRL